jgi:Phage tail tube protein, TTP/Ubiquitin-activating enzyme E1 FCCH domain
MAKGQTLKFQGSTLAVVTGSTGTQAITGATKANPCVLTCTAHTFIVGDVVRISGIVGMTQLNGNDYVVSTVATNSITLFGVDSTDYTTWASGGIAAKGTFSNFCELTGFDRSGGAAADIPVSTICSDAEESEVGLRSFGTLKLDYNYASTAVVSAFEAAQSAGTALMVKRVLPKSAGATVWNTLVLETGEGAQVNEVWKGQASLKITGAAFNFIPV